MSGASVAVGSGGSVPRGAFAGVYPFPGARVRLQEHYISCVGLCSACGGLWFPLHHPRFVEWIWVPQSAGLIEFSGSQWVDKLSRDQAVTAAIHLQRDVGLMQTNVDVVDQYALSLQKAVSRMIDNSLGPCIYPAEEAATGALGPRIRRAAVQMEGMGLWHPSLDPLRLH